MLTLFLKAPSLNGREITLDLTNTSALADLKKTPINIKEGVEYKYVNSSQHGWTARLIAFPQLSSVGITFRVNYDVISGLRYMHVVKRAGMKGE